MKSIIKIVLFNILAIAAVSYIAPGMSYGDNYMTLATAALVLALMNAIVKPFLKVLLLPINIITLGLLSWLVHVIVLYMVTLVVSGFSIDPFTTEVFGGSVIVFSRFWAFVVSSFLLSIVSTLIRWVLD